MKTPRLASWLLALAVPATERDMVLGDLEEAFHRRVREGRSLCRLWYWSQAGLLAVGLFGFAVRDALRPSPVRVRPAVRGVAARHGTGRATQVLEEWAREIRLAGRALARRPGFTAVAVATLALGIGANTALFGVIYSSVLRPLPYDRPQELVLVGERHREQSGGGGDISRPDLEDLASRATLVAGMSAYEIESSNFGTDDEPLRIRGAKVTPGLLEVLGVRPRIGRPFRDTDNHRDAPGTLLLTDELWREAFAADPAVVGRSVQVNAEPHTVLGVLPPGFTFLGDPRFLKPFRWVGQPADRSDRDVGAIGRLAPGADPATAARELQAIYEGMARELPGVDPDWTVVLRTLRDGMVGAAERSLLLVWGAVLLVLAIACVNVANLLLVRAEARRRELAVRFALGSGRGGLVSTFLSEALVLSVLGGAVGLVLAGWGVRLLVLLYGGSLPRVDQISLNPVPLTFGLALALGTGLIVGSVPLSRIDDSRLRGWLREGPRGATDRSNRVKRWLVRVEVALAVTLVCGSGLLVRSFQRLNQVDLGLQAPERVLTFRVSLSGSRYADRASVVDFYARLMEGLERMPGVEVAGLDNRTPLVGGDYLQEITSRDDPSSVARFVAIRSVTPGLFRAIGIPLVSGRLWTDGESSDTMLVDRPVVISQALARRLFPGRDPLGGRMDAEPGQTYRIIGVVGDVRENGPENEPPPMLYVAHPGPDPRSGLVGAVRASGDPLALASLIRSAVQDQDPEIPVYAVRLLSDVAAQRLGPRRLSTSLLSALAGLALLLGAIGIYGVLAFTVSQRARDMGVRLALGASPRRVGILVVTQALGLALPGVGAGLVAAMGAGRLMESMLFGVGAVDPVTYGTVALVAAAVCVLAAVVPARRATRLDPVSSLRAE